MIRPSRVRGLGRQHGKGIGLPAEDERKPNRAREIGLTAGTLGSTASQTVMVAVFPLLITEYARSTFWVGFAVAGEGAFALAVPYWIGRLSDRLPARLAERFGRRRLFMLATAPVMAASVALVPFVSGYWPLAGIAFVYFAALHGYLTPLWALTIDAVPSGRWGRVQGLRAGLHAIGLAYGLIAGGLLYSLWPPLPFLIAAGLIVASTAATLRAAAGRMEEEEPEQKPWRELFEDSAVRWFLLGNALWTGAVDGIRPYIFLFAVTVLGLSVAESSAAMVVLVLGLGVGAVVLGRVSDRHDRSRLLMIGVVATGVALVPGVFLRDISTVLPVLVVAGLGAAAVLALPFPLYADLVGGEAMGSHTGLYVASLGAGRMLAPLLVGAAIDASAGWVGDEGYPIMWPAAGALMLLGAASLARVRRG